MHGALAPVNEPPKLAKFLYQIKPHLVLAVASLAVDISCNSRDIIFHEIFDGVDHGFPIGGPWEGRSDGFTLTFSRPWT